MIVVEVAGEKHERRELDINMVNSKGMCAEVKMIYFATRARAVWHELKARA